MLQRFLLVWLSLLCLIAYYWQNAAQSIFGTAADKSTAAQQYFDPFIASKPYLVYLIIVTMFAIGALLPTDEVRQVLARWPRVLQGTLLQYLAMPLLAYTIGQAFQFDPAIMTGVIIVGCVPGAMASNVLTLAARGNVSYSVSLTTSATLLSPVFVPLAFWLFLGKSLPVDPLDVAGKLLYQVVGPVVAGHLLSRRFESFQRSLQVLGPIVANLTILWIVATVFALNRDKFSAAVASVMVALLLINLAGYATGYLGGKLLRFDEPLRRALTLEIGMQNAGLGTVLAGQLFSDEPRATIAPALYTFGCMLTGTILAQYWRWRPLPEAKETLKTTAD